MDIRANRGASNGATSFPSCWPHQHTPGNDPNWLYVDGNSRMINSAVGAGMSGARPFA